MEQDWMNETEGSYGEDLHKEKKNKKGLLIAIGGLLVLALVLFLVLGWALRDLERDIRPPTL